MARLPPSRHPLHCGLRIPDLRARDDSPLNRTCHQRVPAICLTRSLPAQRIRRCGPNATFRTRLQQCDGDWWPLSPRCYRVAHAARLGTDEICDTVRLKCAARGPRTTLLLLKRLDDADVTHRAIAQRLEGLLVGGTCIGSDGLLDAREFRDDDALF